MDGRQPTPDLFQHRLRALLPERHPLVGREPLGIGQMLISMSRWIKTPTGFATAVVCSLHPVYWAFHRVLCQQAEAGPPLLGMGGQ